MSDFRDPLTGNVGYEPADRRNAGWR